MPTSQEPESAAPQQATGAWRTRWGLLLRMARQVEGLSLTELAERSGLSKGYLSKLESAHPSAANPSRATLAALARALPSTISLIQHLAPEDGLPTPASLVSGQWSVIASQHPPTPPARRATDLTAPATGTHQHVLPTLNGPLPPSWTEWEILLSLVIVESAGFGPPTQAVLERACQVEAPLDDLLAQLEQDGLIRKLPPGSPGGPVRYTCQHTRLDHDHMQRPAHLFMQAAMNLLLGIGTGKKET